MKSGNEGSGLVAAGLGWGLAAGLAVGVLLIAPAMTAVGGGAGEASIRAADAADPRAEVASAEAAAANEVLAQQAEGIVAGTLEGESVLVLRTQGASDESVSKLRWLLNTARAEDAGTIALTEKFASQDGANELSTVISNTLPAGAQISVDNIAPGVHAGEAFASALSLNESDVPTASDADRAFFLETLVDAGFIEYEPDSVTAADAVVLITGPTGEQPSFGDKLLGDFADAYNSSGGLLVYATPAVAESGEGAPRVGFADTEAGRVKTIATLNEELG